MTSSFPWLTVLGLIPLVTAVVVFALPTGVAGRAARPVALVGSLAALVVGIAMWTQFKTGTTDHQFQFVETHEWIRQFGVSYQVGIDGLALALILMSLVLVPVSLLAAWRDVPADGTRRMQNYFALMLVLETFMVGVFSATDVFLFYVFFEAMLIPVYFLIGSYGGARRQYAAVKFLLFSLLGGFVMLIAVIALYNYGPGGHQGFLLSNLTGLHLGTWPGRWLFLGFFFAFAVKAPMWPVHTWLPDAASESRPATAVLLVGVLDKVGTFGMIRFCLQLFPDASKWATPVIIVLALISIIYGALVAIGQTDIMRLIAYTSISHFGFIVLGIFAMTSTSEAGSDLYMVNHGFTTAALFLFGGFLVVRGKSRDIRDYGGWQRVTPVLAGVMLIAGLSALSLPGMNSFISEFLVMAGTFQRYKVAGGVAAVGVILAALYVLLLYKNVFTGPAPLAHEAGDGEPGEHGGGDGRAGELVPAGGGSVATQAGQADGPHASVHGEHSEHGEYAASDEGDQHGAHAAGHAPTGHAAARGRVLVVPDLDLRERVVAGVLVAIIVALGFYPKPVLDVLRPATNATMNLVQMHDPAPSVPTSQVNSK
ncbi:NADH-quinone oxidoreductase subunit M [Allobranchiibius huperziae]|uniref:NADH-quinone oxidoreductase subunit M n=1 Tax=Allobranchiibius huperziae TaxID=1874116 RepID=A0A853DGA8_9MICO|nr:NADH-quinone oxidoreductase subunit M [Allobranchiibius huperziae]NYJ75828.1 NADH-quinone oxidoreductase subunit M [Allobranchiibius huperziae]